MKRIISLLLTIILIAGILPTNVFADHQHYYEYEDSIFTQHPHRMSLYACECGKKIEIDRAYLAGCKECSEELCNQGFHTYCNGYSYADREHFNVYCVCGDSMTIPIDHVMYMEQDMNNICQDFNIEIANEKDRAKHNQKDIFKAVNEDINTLFSESATSEHPHSGVYETRTGEQVFLDYALNGECRYCVSEELCDNYNAHSGLYDYEVYDDYVEFLCYCGKQIKVSFSRLNDFFDDRCHDNIDICEDINFDLAEDAYYNSYGNFDISATVEPEYIEEEIVESTLSGTVSSPQTYSNGKLAVTAELSSNYNITSVYVYVTNSGGATVAEGHITVNSTDVVIDEYSEINSQLCLETLPTGTYDIFLEVSDCSGTTASCSFSQIEFVQNNYAGEDSELEINFSCIPEVIREKGGFGLRGYVSSNYEVTSVYGYIKDMKGNTLASSYDSPNSTYMDIKSARLNHDLTFGILSNGTYEIVVVAYDSSGSEVTLEHKFSVERPNNTTNNESDSCLIDGKYTIEEWNELFGHIIYSGNFQPTYMEVKTKDATVHISALDASAVVGYPPKGTTLAVIGKCTNKYNNIWYLVEYSGKVCYIYSGDLKTSETKKNAKPDVADIILNGTSDVLTIVGLIPFVDTFANLLQVPVDILRDDWISAGLSLAGAVPFVGETADATKTVRLADKSADAIRAAKKADKVGDAAKLVDANKLNHIFNKAEHKLSPLLNKFDGNMTNAYIAVQNAAQNAVDTHNLKGVFDSVMNPITVNIKGITINVGGKVVDGTFNIGTFYAK